MVKNRGRGAWIRASPEKSTGRVGRGSLRSLPNPAKGGWRIIRFQLFFRALNRKISPVNPPLRGRNELFCTIEPTFEKIYLR
ncbi:MAG: hypothetical protein ACUVXA_00565 [Candidatus Jordarchaeum sp.]|uniref:hypothetical protein n=1 Tax=Candidatus Jordarchaeum sp. TaxID=2823881 RepID=UPI00404AEEE7